MDLCHLKNPELATHLQNTKEESVSGKTTYKMKKDTEQALLSKVPQLRR